MVMMVTIVVQLCGSGALLPFEAMPDFFRIGYGLPLKYAIAGAKAIMLGSLENDLSEDVGVLWTWLLGLTIVLIFGIYSEEVGAIMTRFRLHLFEGSDNGETNVVEQDGEDGSEGSKDIEDGSGTINDSPIVVEADSVKEKSIDETTSKYGSLSVFKDDGRPKLKTILFKGAVVEVIL